MTIRPFGSALAAVSNCCQVAAQSRTGYISHMGPIIPQTNACCNARCSQGWLPCPGKGGLRLNKPHNFNNESATCGRVQSPDERRASVRRSSVLADMMHYQSSRTCSPSAPPSLTKHDYWPPNQHQSTSARMTNRIPCRRHAPARTPNRTPSSRPQRRASPLTGLTCTSPHSRAQVCQR